ncbi:40S ribosomal protein, variant 4 [Schistosoma haematobium]|uniref:40S ribosomal protein S8 n=1 Tax=Schistosoma haematobium TaxID=6185 RepID=A0A094ZQT7_SCHHA|nr:40S ribosomal protein, variant 4 [Schistosoma haematobium]KAH9596011.1 40S ribosomal protein, variant 4 [Schistosoma haematobium]
MMCSIARDRIHKRAKTGARRERNRKKRKFELGRPAAMTKLGAKRVHTVRVRGGNIKLRAMRLDQGNFSWPSQAISRKTKIIDVVYNASSNELVRTKTLVKRAIVQIDGAPFRQWFEAHYLKELGRRKVVSKKGHTVTQENPEEDILLKKRSKSALKKYETRQALPQANVEEPLKEAFVTGRLLAVVLWNFFSTIQFSLWYPYTLFRKTWIFSSIDVSKNSLQRLLKRSVVMFS